VSALPTTPPDTVPGVVLGTIGYMAPEQVRGLQADHRSDIFGFGAILYEMLSGQRAFRGDTAADTMGAILANDPPDLPTAERHISPALVRIVDRCLEKSPTARFQSTRDLAFALEGLSAHSEAGVSRAIVGRTPYLNNARLAWMFAALFLVLSVASLVLGAVGYLQRTVPAEAPEMRLEITTPPTSDPASLAISPDGTKVVFVATFEGRSLLWLRSLDSASGRPLSGTDHAVLPFWSPDGRSVAFFADGSLKRINIDDGSTQILAIAPAPRGGAWNRDGTILFAPSPGSPILRTSASGGEPTPVTRLESPSQVGHSFPQFLPGGRHFLYYVRGTPEARGLHIGQLNGSEPRRLRDADSAPLYVSSGQLLFVAQGTLFAQNFDPVRLALTGAPSPVAEQVMVNALLNLPAVSASSGGAIVYRAGTARGDQRQFIWFDRSGKEIGKVGSPDSATVLGPAISPDGRRVALYRTESGNTDVWLLDLARGVLSRLTSDTANDIFPIWSPDGRSIVFTSTRRGSFDLYQKLATGARSEELLLASAQPKIPTDWSRDGRVLLYHSPDPKTSADIWALPLDGDRKPLPVVRTNFEERDGQFSPDGKWIAYQSNESGRFEIYVESLPGPDANVSGKSLISTNGGSQVRWRLDGKELFYIALDDRLMAVPIEFASNSQALEVGTPVPLFATRVGGAVQYANRQQYMVSPDGQRFLMNTLTEEATSPITVILNWVGAQKR